MSRWCDAQRLARAWQIVHRPLLMEERLRPREYELFDLPGDGGTADASSG